MTSTCDLALDISEAIGFDLFYPAMETRTKKRHPEAVRVIFESGEPSPTPLAAT